ncbi:MAG TPA: hypothetical protein VMM60_12005 [Ilumatobacter sp.]|nr:hypothetical protein [Ilumatobacter sp.]
MLVAARGSDRDLDLALLRVGVLAPADLGPIKTVLTLDGVALRSAVNPDGHCVIEVLRAGEPLGYLHHNGDVDLFDAVIAVVAA